MAGGKRVFVTVGTTKFDELIDTITSDGVLKVLASRGYSELVLQIGRSSLEPKCSNPWNIRVSYFHLKPSIAEFLREADLVISHAGAGSCLEALEAGKPLIVVVNDALMGNHQLELASRLVEDGCLSCCTTRELRRLLEDFDPRKLEPRSLDKSRKIVGFVDRVMGF